MKTAKRIMFILSITALLCCLLSVAAFAAGSGDVAGAVESTWTVPKIVQRSKLYFFE